MKSTIFTLLLIFCTITLYAQETRVLISEEKKGKRITLYGENTTQDTLNVFFMVQSEGFRRSADRPTIKFINPGEKISLITMIELANVPSSYNYTLVVNEEENNKSITHEKPTIDIEKQVTGKLVLFIDEDCQKCEYLKTLLTNNRIKYQLFDIDGDPELFHQFNLFVKKKHPEVDAIRLPVIWNKNEMLLGFDDANDILNYLNE